MSFLAKILGSGVLQTGKEIFDDLHDSPEEQHERTMERVKAEHSYTLAERKLDQELLMGQVAINKIEAQHKSVFVSGWRPFVGWVCGIALGYQLILHPIASAFLDLPPVDTQTLLSVLVSMLGLAGYRSYEKGKGVATNLIRSPA